MADIDEVITEWVGDEEDSPVIVTGWALIVTFERLDEPDKSFYRRLSMPNQQAHCTEGLASRLARDTIRDIIRSGED